MLIYFTISFLFTFADDCRAREARVLSARSSADADALSADADALGIGSTIEKTFILFISFILISNRLLNWQFRYFFHL